MSFPCFRRILHDCGPATLDQDAPQYLGTLLSGCYAEVGDELQEGFGAPVPTLLDFDDKDDPVVVNGARCFDNQEVGNHGTLLPSLSALTIGINGSDGYVPKAILIPVLRVPVCMSSSLPTSPSPSPSTSLPSSFSLPDPSIHAQSSECASSSGSSVAGRRVGCGLTIRLRRQGKYAPR
ncbi:hypothetical protein JVT61DRAFT_12384 [Boletus reticuloceps]|uniref:Uncharacterized protein n=1 Tax=Boletus reticuloceps TaxID=495285 RepID=A0A8I2YE63_9AGAM|nr:hypothetical protein JVT61DRAFT_12293 [Boletus reticuloceps]KAG6370229.1 hypothetical protein JVT61DRAFT_12384 [Boletus reticuloceps]